MKNKILVLVCLVFYFTLNTLSAQEKLSITEALAFKKQVKHTAKKTTSIVSGFIQEKHLSILENTIISEGILKFKAPNKVLWEYTKPYENTAIFKGDKLFVSNEGKTAEINLNSNRLFRSLNALIVNSVKGDMFDDEEFAITYFKHPNGFMVTFQPNNKRLSKFINTFELQFSKNGEVNSVKLIEPNADFTTISFINKQINVPVLNAAFL
ncbi:outer membrane lipoprotein carrier protein LolA [Bizionia gelidisalsuginis]|uniref:Outer membrane lipoprotein carrier protein LolA n=2 Tax=Bizionia TaxID=283785 RepID=A0A8H2LGU7_9FLAO|nr:MULTISPECIES: outer-membrane lipoprotein carrier protein LolA [Bizionia]TYB74102.1 outer membrane lipoprotein carrier protein LolA [Bizionia saleffrena]TYC15550.1 outer membrane lipoprotein carrier protein LolA [Bizionia gelidisalsuginis]